MPESPGRAEIANDRSTPGSNIPNPTHSSRKHTTQDAQAALIVKARRYPTQTAIKAVCPRHLRPRAFIQDPHLERVLHVTRHHPPNPKQPRPRPNGRIHLSSTPTHPINIHQQPYIKQHQHAKPHLYCIPIPTKPHLLHPHPRFPSPTPTPIRPPSPSLPNTNNTNPPQTHPLLPLLSNTLPPAPTTKTLAKRLHSLRALRRVRSHGRPHLPVPLRRKHDPTHGVRAGVWEPVREEHGVSA